MNASSRLRHAILLLGAAAALHAPATSQELFGRWEDDPTGGSIEFFVSPTGSDMNAGSAQAPWRTLTFAMGLAGQIWGDPAVTPLQVPTPLRITINVAPGLYSVATGEQFPLRGPAHGLALETWPEGGAMPPGDRPVIDTGFTAEAILIDWIGPESMPATVIQGLEIQNASPGVLIDPSLQPMQIPPVPTVPLAVELRSCFIHDCAPGLELNTATKFMSTFVIEDNDIGDDTPIQQRGIIETCTGTASTLYRSNRIQFYEEGFTVLGNGVENTVPRVFSNFIQIGERLLNISNCGSFVVNNTVAYAMNFTGVPVVNGVTITGGTVEFHNNIVWCPDTPMMVPAVDLTITGASNQMTNLIEDAAFGAVPDFVSGNVHPGLAAVDLHLAPFSALVGAGTNAMAVDPADTVAVAIAGAIPVRTDVTVDNDMDSRLFLSAVEPGVFATVDVGADEMLTVGAGGLPECRITLPTTPTQDRFGNVLAQPVTTPGQRTWLGDLQLSGPSGGVWFLVLGYGYFDQIVDPSTGLFVQNGSVYHDLVPSFAVPSLGNLSVDILGPSMTIATGAFGPLGTTMLAGLSMGTTVETMQEVEWQWQMVTFDPATGRFAASNRVKIELNERP